MRIGIGLPNHVRGVDTSVIVDWARPAEQRGFASLATIDRLIYPSVESVVALAAAAGATSDIGLTTNILVAPIYPGVLLAKQLIALAGIAGERLTVGLGVGNREDEYAATGTDFAARGRALDDVAKLLVRARAGETVTEDGAYPIAPRPVRMPLAFGGRAQPTIRRIAEFGDGWAGDGFRDYDDQAAFVDRVRAAWTNAGRVGHPRLTAVANFALGDRDTLDAAHDQMFGLYSQPGGASGVAAAATAAMVHSAAEVSATIRAYADLGFDEVLFHPSVARLDQLDRLAESAL